MNLDKNTVLASQWELIQYLKWKREEVKICSLWRLLKSFFQVKVVKKVTK